MIGRSIGILLTLSCPSKCRHCYLSSSPNKTEEIDLDTLKSFIHSISLTRRFSSICFSGGEPFYKIKTLRQAVQRVADYGMRPAVVTSGFWAKTPEIAMEVLSSLPNLAELHLSTDIFHQEFVPVESIRNAVIAAKKLNIWTITIAVTTLHASEREKIVKYMEGLLDKKYIFTQDLIPLGRGAYELKQEELLMGRKDSQCDDLTMPAITATGEVLACCGPALGLPWGHPLLAGNLKYENLEKILNKIEADNLLHLLRHYGPWGVAMLLEQAKIGFSPGENFIRGCACDLCLAILGRDEYISHLRQLLAGDLGKKLAITVELERRIKKFELG